MRPDLRVIDGDGVESPPVVSREGSRRRLCQCLRIELDHEARRCYCQDCGAEVDSFAFLEELARDFKRWSISRDRAKGEYEWYAREVEDLKRQQRNLKAQIRRASR